MLRKLLALLSDAAVYGISSMLTRIVGMLLLPILTGYLTRADYGTVHMLSFSSLLFGPLVNLGMTSAIFRHFNSATEGEDRECLLTTALSSAMAFSVVWLTICLIYAEPISQVLLGRNDAANYLRLALTTAAISNIGMVPFVAFRAARRVRLAASLNITSLAISSSITVVLVVYYGYGIWGVLLGNLIGTVSITLLQFGLILPTLRIKPDLLVWKKLVSYGGPMVPYQFQAVGMELFSLSIISHMLGPSIAGIYAAAVRTASPVSFIVGAIQSSWVAHKFLIKDEDANPQEFFGSSFLYYLVAVAYLWVGASLWGPEVIRLLTAPSYHSAIHVVWAVTLIPVVQGIYHMLGTGFELSDNTYAYPIVSLTGMLAVVLSVIPLINAWGALGSAIATNLGWVTMATSVYFFSQRRFHIAYDWRTIWSILVLAVPFVLLASLIQDQPLSIRLAASTFLSLLFPILSFFVLLRSKTEHARMAQVLERISSVLRRSSRGTVETSRDTAIKKPDSQ